MKSLAGSEQSSSNFGGVKGESIAGWRAPVLDVKLEAPHECMINLQSLHLLQWGRRKKNLTIPTGTLRCITHNRTTKKKEYK